MIQADTPPASPPAAEVVIARSDHTTVAASLDLPLSLVKAGRREEMVVRRVLFVNASVTQVRPAAGGSDRYRWTLAGFLEREYCVRSLTGVLGCTTPEVAPLPDKAEGEALLAAPGDVSLAVQAEGLLSSTLAARSDEIFAADRQAAVDPFIKAAGVKVGGATAAKAVPPRSAGRPAKGAPAAGGG
ncbi:hypothetical protein [Phenylobacterium sp.]|jgi:hypothetical protein|uniref:hypothetical protein n=1 Tax=Phenylobacterium sp. TaxID=1871053 RepID=UPI002E381FCB|nr:hypothetical protein [Phenylobacterium sp.]HEX3365017.1 hypothetical protein [Phenylobacterium sp.]